MMKSQGLVLFFLRTVVIFMALNNTIQYLVERKINAKYMHSICIQISEWEINFKVISCKVPFILHFTRLDFLLL